MLFDRRGSEEGEVGCCSLEEDRAFAEKESVFGKEETEAVLLRSGRV